MTQDFFRSREYYSNTADTEAAVLSIEKIAATADVVVPGHENYFLNRRQCHGRKGASSYMQESSKLGLGGHSYMQQLGNDPKPAFEEQCEIVSACLDNGIHLFDTTYYQERVALGGILERLG